MTGSVGSAKTSLKGNRLEFLDAARAIAALAVVLQHSLETYFPAVTSFGQRFLNLGAFGVVVFFLVSGFIIPASLERSQKLTTFWANRFFRLYPMYWVSLIVALTVGLSLPFDLPAAFWTHPFATTLVNVTMLQSFLNLPDVLGVYWTLSLELAFYLFCSVLFAAGWLNKSLLWAWMAVGSMGICFLAAGLLFHRSLPAGRLGLLVTAFVGTAIFRTYSKHVDKKKLWILLFGTLVCLLIGFWFRFHQYHATGKNEGWDFGCVVTSWTAAYILFAILLLLRARQFPEWLLWVGRISYSLYLIHGIVLMLLPKSFSPIVSFSEAISISIVASAMTYKFVEKPAIAFHRNRVHNRRTLERPIQVP